MQDTGTTQVKRRQVFYIPGFDPMPPRRYRELYRKESAAQAAICGYRISLSPGANQDGFGWQVAGGFDEGDVAVQMDVLVWSDIVRDVMKGSVAATFILMLRTAWTYLRSGALWRLMRLRKGPIIAALYPVVMLLGQLIVAVLLGYATFVLTGAAFGMLLPSEGLSLIMLGIRAACAGLVSLAALRGFKRIDGRLYAYYLMHDYAFAASRNGANPAPLEDRIAAFAQRIELALSSKADEVLVIGHSSGASLAVSAVSDVLRARDLKQNHPCLSLLTLGQVVPMTSFLPNADRLRADLAFMAAQSDVPWIDVSAPGDGCAFALCDPVAVTGVAPAEKHWPLVLSAAFSQSLSPERWNALRWRFFRLHFQYLCAFDMPQGYDYFRITAGPQTLGALFDGRTPSPSRIETPRNRHTSIAA